MGDEATTAVEPSKEPAVEHVAEMLCPDCNYNIRGVESDRCPECGIDITDVKLRKSQIPWVHRGEIGRFRAYWKTVWVVSIPDRAFANEIGRPAHLADAKLFRWLTIPIAFVPFVGVAAVSILGAGVNSPSTMPPSYGELSFNWAIGLLGLLCCIALVTAIPYYALRSREIDVELQHRAAVLCLYAASAPMAMVFIACGLVIAGLLVGQMHRQDMLDAVLMLSGGGVFTIILSAAFAKVMLLIKRTMKTSQRQWWMSLKIGALCLAGVVLTLGGIPAGFFLLAFVYYSFH